MKVNNNFKIDISRIFLFFVQILKIFNIFSSYEHAYIAEGCLFGKWSSWSEIRFRGIRHLRGPWFGAMDKPKVGCTRSRNFWCFARNVSGPNRFGGDSILRKESSNGTVAASPVSLVRWHRGERGRERESERTRKTDEQEERVDDRRTPWRGRSFARVESSMIVARELP